VPTGKIPPLPIPSERPTKIVVETGEDGILEPEAIEALAAFIMEQQG
tara:strand:+ start:454 stop:594 length:141 start_codon:yes stop_codon:yes gene_type:complete